MTRGALCLTAVAVLGCKDRAASSPPPARYEAVKAAAPSGSHWCDHTFAAAAPRLTLPPLAVPAAGRSQAGLAAGQRTWVNLWATWCAPCLRELPLLLAWQQDLRKDGLDVDVLLLSLDEDAETFAQFLAEHREFASAKVGRVAAQRDYEEWVKAYVKDPATPIPLHLLAAADGHLRCVRGGSLREGDYPAARAALR
jgi:thiol-disulfide isomerase/thioredoxin